MRAYYPYGSYKTKKRAAKKKIVQKIRYKIRPENVFFLCLISRPRTVSVSARYDGKPFNKFSIILYTVILLLVSTRHTICSFNLVFTFRDIFHRLFRSLRLYRLTLRIENFQQFRISYPRGKKKYKGFIVLSRVSVVAF